MPLSRDEIEAQDEELERVLEKIIANPALAEMAFPDPEMREKILPVFRGFRELGRTGLSK